MNPTSRSSSLGWKQGSQPIEPKVPEFEFALHKLKTNKQPAYDVKPSQIRSVRSQLQLKSLTPSRVDDDDDDDVPLQFISKTTESNPALFNSKRLPRGKQNLPSSPLGSSPIPREMASNLPRSSPVQRASTPACSMPSPAKRVSIPVRSAPSSAKRVSTPLRSVPSPAQRPGVPSLSRLPPAQQALKSGDSILPPSQDSMPKGTFSSTLNQDTFSPESAMTPPLMTGPSSAASSAISPEEMKLTPTLKIKIPSRNQFSIPPKATRSTSSQSIPVTTNQASDSNALSLDSLVNNDDWILKDNLNIMSFIEDQLKNVTLEETEPINATSVYCDEPESDMDMNISHSDGYNNEEVSYFYDPIELENHLNQQNSSVSPTDQSAYSYQIHSNVQPKNSEEDHISLPSTQKHDYKYDPEIQVNTGTELDTEFLSLNNQGPKLDDLHTDNLLQYMAENQEPDRSSPNLSRTSSISDPTLDDLLHFTSLVHSPTTPHDQFDQDLLLNPSFLNRDPDLTLTTPPKLLKRNSTQALLELGGQGRDFFQSFMDFNMTTIKSPANLSKYLSSKPDARELKVRSAEIVHDGISRDTQRQDERENLFANILMLQDMVRSNGSNSATDKDSEVAKGNNEVETSEIVLQGNKNAALDPTDEIKSEVGANQLDDNVSHSVPSSDKFSITSIPALFKKNSMYGPDDHKSDFSLKSVLRNSYNPLSKKSKSHLGLRGSYASDTNGPSAVTKSDKQASTNSPLWHRAKDMMKTSTSQLILLRGGSPIYTKSISVHYLNPHTVALLVVKNLIFMWVGKLSSSSHYDNAFEHIRSQFHSIGHNLSIQKEGFEDPEFTQLFEDWDRPITYDCGKLQTELVEIYHQPPKAIFDPLTDHVHYGVAVWSVRDNVKLDSQEYGVFFDHEAYRVIYSYYDSNQQLQHIIFYWMGRSYREPPQPTDAHRFIVLQGAEPPSFMKLFQGTLVVKWGLRKSTPQRGLYRVQGTSASNVKIHQTTYHSRSLCTGHCFILIHKTTVYVWHGSGSYLFERLAAASAAYQLAPQNTNIIEIQESHEPPQFWSKLNSRFNNPEYDQSQHWIRRPFQANPTRVRLIRLAVDLNSGLDLKEMNNFHQQDLCPSSIYLLDTYSHLFLYCQYDPKWLTLPLNHPIRTHFFTCLALTLEYVDQVDQLELRSSPLVPTLVEPTYEPCAFTSAFPSWNVAIVPKSTWNPNVFRRSSQLPSITDLLVQDV